MASRLTVLIGGTAAILSATVFAIGFCRSCNPPGFTVENVKLLKKGMTRLEVEALFDCPGACIREGGSLHESDWVWQWKGRGGEVRLLFIGPFDSEKEATLRLLEWADPVSKDFEFYVLENQSIWDRLRRVLCW